MMNGKKLSQLREFRIARPVFDLLWNWLAIAAAHVAFARNPTSAIGVLCAAIIGVHIHRLLILGHEAAHYLLFRNRTMNDWFGNLFCFLPVAATVEGYRDWHLRHHRYLGTPSDPELIIKRGWWYRAPAGTRKFFAMAILDLAGCGVREISVILWDARPRRARTRVLLSLYWLGVSAIVFRLHLWPNLSLHLLSVLTFMWVVSRLRNWSEHVSADLTHRIHGNWFWNYCVTPHNTLYHYEHHRWPSVPYYNLPACRSLDEHVPVISLASLFQLFAQGQPSKTANCLQVRISCGPFWQDFSR